MGVSLFNTNTAVPMVAIMATSAVLALGILLLGRRLIGTTLVSTDGQAMLVH
ncbi:hypothetical protein [Hymenobacter sp. AT01-02]|uniref:hypothetical protein n=1 Tax=Hymenobacter sp. AT01-02 TaxID=1571877 RepID=UPI00293528FC|nr:hypothetical protein [Hymenobacter sp. AT01-02]